jgi:hypothetical protein
MEYEMEEGRQAVQGAEQKKCSSRQYGFCVKQWIIFRIFTFGLTEKLSWAKGLGSHI